MLCVVIPNVVAQLSMPRGRGLWVSNCDTHTHMHTNTNTIREIGGRQREIARYSRGRNKEKMEKKVYRQSE